MKKRLSILVFVTCLLHTAIGFAFTLSITPTNETCPGNATLTLTPSGTNPSGSMVYFVYKLPNTTTPVASGPDTVISGLTAGDYRIIAKETVGSTTTQVQQDVTITSTFVPLSYTLQSLNQACTTSSNILVTVVTGTAATYEIFSGPVTVPPQTSNTFTGLPVGTYTIKVIDSCGNAVVQTYTTTLNPASLSVAGPVFTDTVPPSCTSIVVSNTVTASAGTVIGYPLQVQYTLHVPGGPPVVIQQIVNSGGTTSTDISQTVPFFVNQSYPYDIVITDACGTTYPPSSFFIENDITLAGAQVLIICNTYYFTTTAGNFSSSYTLNFISVPAGFNPSAFNAAYPGPYTQNSIDFGSPTSPPVPFGSYTVVITDPCGKTKTVTFDVISRPPVPDAIATNNGCLANNGRIVVQIPSYKIVTAIITAAPASYPFTLPHNVSAFIDINGIVTLDPVPLGDYTFVLTDNCNDVIPPVNVTIPPYTDGGLSTVILQSCDLGKASIKISSNNDKLLSVRILAAPAGYPFTLPQDISNLIIASGALFLNNISTGNYTFEATDACGFTNTITENIQGYSNASSSFSLIANCGSFDIPLNFVSNVGVAGNESFWLQELLNPITNTWGNPATGVPYPEGTPPDTINSFPLNNNTTNYNLTFNGTFRIVRHFNSFNNGSDINSGTVNSENKDCIEILSPTLSYNNALEINDVYRIPCSATGNLDVILFTHGTPPLHYRITEKDGLPFAFDNGTSNIFLNIAPGIYKFEVADNCGNAINRTFDVSDLTSLVIVYPTCPLFSCVAAETGNETFDLTTQTPVILGSQVASDYTLTYYTTQADADAGSNAIANLTTFNPTTNPQTIYTRLIYNSLPNCYQTGSFDLIVGQTPKVNLNPDYFECDSQPVVLDASLGNIASTTYIWSNGAVTPSITISQVGVTNVSVTAENSYGNCNTVTLGCTAQKDITVTISDIPTIDHIELADWTYNENSITVITTNNGVYEYSLDGSPFQASNIFDHLKPGVYTVYVRDLKGCKTLNQEVWLLNYPQFFTPNGDGINDKWFIRNSDKEPHFTVLIYDRYGKLMTSFKSDSEGWDGTVNGRLVFSTDYWFVVNREDGRVLKGHFTLKR